MSQRARQITVFAGVGVVIFLALGWWIRGVSAQDACLDRGGSWHAESGTCGGMRTPGGPVEGLGGAVALGTPPASAPTRVEYTVAHPWVVSDVRPACDSAATMVRSSHRVSLTVSDTVWPALQIDIPARRGCVVRIQLLDTG